MKLHLFSVLALASGTFGAVVLTVLDQTEELSALNSYVTNSSILTKLLSSADNFTFLAPSNAAIEEWLSSSDTLTTDVIDTTLTYHLLHGRFPTLSFTPEPQFVHSFLENITYANVTGGQVVELLSQNGQAQVGSGNKSISTIASPAVSNQTKINIQRLELMIRLGSDLRWRLHPDNQQRA